MSNSSQVKDQVIRALESDPESAPYLLRLPPQDKSDLYAMLGRISDIICGSAKGEIIEHIDEREIVYMKTLKAAMDKLGEKFEDSIAKAIEAQGKVNAGHNRRITDLEHGQTFQEHQMNQLRTSADNNIELTKQVKELVLVLTERFDQSSKISRQPSKQLVSAPKKNKIAKFISELPVAHWALILLFLAFIFSLFSGHLNDLTTLVEAYKGAKGEE